LRVYPLRKAARGRQYGTAGRIKKLGMPRFQIDQSGTEL
jgi:hypothetical protein